MLMNVPARRFGVLLCAASLLLGGCAAQAPSRVQAEHLRKVAVPTAPLQLPGQLANTLDPLYVIDVDRKPLIRTKQIGPLRVDVYKHDPANVFIPPALVQAKRVSETYADTNQFLKLVSEGVKAGQFEDPIAVFYKRLGEEMRKQGFEVVPYMPTLGSRAWGVPANLPAVDAVIEVQPKMGFRAPNRYTPLEGYLEVSVRLGKLRDSVMSVLGHQFWDTTTGVSTPAAYRTPADVLRQTGRAIADLNVLAVEMAEILGVTLKDPAQWSNRALDD
jgi:hypothetical protein